MLTIFETMMKRLGRAVAPLGLAAVCYAGATTNAHSQSGPPNDNLTNAQVILGPSGIAYGNNFNATAESNEPPAFINPPQASVWYLWTAPYTTTMDFSTRYSVDGNENVLGTVMAVYSLTGSNLVYSNLTLVASNAYDPSSGVTNGDSDSRVDFPVTLGQVYLVQIDGSTNTPNGSNDQGNIQLNWSPSLVGGTFGFSVNGTGNGASGPSAGAFFCGEFDDVLLENCSPQAIEPSLHNAGGSNNIRVTVTRQGGYTGKCEVTLIVTNSYYFNTLYTNYTGTNIFVTNYDTNGFLPSDVINYTNTFFTNVATSNSIQDYVDQNGTLGILTLPVYSVYTVNQTNAPGLGTNLSKPVTNKFTTLTGLSIQTNFWANFPCVGNQITTSAPVTNGSIVTVTTTQIFCSNYITNTFTPSASNSVDYVAYSNVLVFNDFQMSKDVYLQVNPLGAQANGGGSPLPGPDWPDMNGNKLYYGINPVLTLSLTNAVLDPAENQDITPPTISQGGSNTLLSILSFTGDPFNSIQGGAYLTPAAFPNGPVTINLERATFRVNKPAAATGANTPPSSNVIYLYVVLAGNPGLNDTYTVNYTIDCQAAGQLVNVPTGDAFKWNDFPTVAGSDYAQNSHYGITDFDFTDPVGTPGAGGNPGPCAITALKPSTFSGNYGTLTFGPFNNSGSAVESEIAIPIDNWGSTEFDVDMFVQLFISQPNSSNPNLTQKVPGFIGNLACANLTINYSGIEPGGAYDVSFNPAGSSTASQPAFNQLPGANPPPANGGAVYAVAMQPNGQAVIGGFFTTYNLHPVYGIERLLTNGWYDPTFNNVSQGGVNGFVDAIVIDPAGNIIIGGGFSSYDNNIVPTANIARLTSTGALDTSFNTGSGFNSDVYAMALDANGNILVGGDFTSYNSVPCSHIVRLLPNGALDSNFLPDTGNGQQNFGTDGDVNAVALDNNGNIIIGGQFNHINGTSLNYLARLLPTGALDTGFLPAGPDGYVYSLAIETNNEIVIGGAFENYNSSSSPGVALVATNGSLDTTFPVGSGADGEVFSVVLQPNGEVLVGGQFRNFNTTRRLGVARLLSNGWVDTSFMDTSYNQYAGLINAFYNEETEPIHTAFAMAVQPDGNIMMGGSFTNIGGGTARDAIGTQINVTRLIGAPTAGPMTGGGGNGNTPGNITLTEDPYSSYNTSGKVYVTLDRVNGSLGPAQVTLGTNTLSPGPGSATAQDFGLIIPGSTPLYNDVYAHWFENPPGTYGWRQSDGYWGYNILPTTGANNALLPVTDLGDSSLNLDIFYDSSSAQNLSADLSLLDVTELNITTPPKTGGPLTLGGVVIPTFPALGIPSAPLEILNNNFPVGYVGFSVTNYTTLNTSNTVTITVLRTNGTSGSISVVAFTQNGTALSGSNYTGIAYPPGKTLNFFPGQTAVSFTIPILNKSSFQSTKSFALVLTNPSPAGVLYTNIPPLLSSTSTVSIIDGNFTAGHLAFTSPTYSVLKPGVATIGVQRIGGATGQLTVQVGTSNNTAINGSNYVGSTNTLSWGTGDVSTKTVTVQTLQDNTVDGNVSLNLNLFNAQDVGNSNQNSLVLFSPSNATLTIMESDSYGSLSFAAPVNDGVPNFNVLQDAGQALITVSRSGGVTGTITVNYTTTNDNNPTVGNFTAQAGTNYGATSGTLTFGPGVTSQTFPVQIYYTPTESAGNRMFNVLLTNAVNNGVTNTNGFILTATVTIDDPQLVYSPAGSVDTTTQNGQGFNGFVNSLNLQPDGSILAGGDFTIFNFYPFEFMARLNTDGAYDSTFLFDQAGANGNIYQILSQTTSSTQTNNGPIMIAGNFSSVDGVTRNNIARLNINGSVDETFNPGAGADSAIYSLVETLLPTGVPFQTNLAFYIGGNFANFNGVACGGIARLNGSSNSPGYQGGIDPDFNVGQGVTGGSGAIRALAVQADGSVIVGGDFTSFNSATHNHLVRLNSAGVLDSTFTPGTGSAAANSVEAIAIQPDGRILIGGSFTNVTDSNGSHALNYLARLNTDGTVDNNFNVGFGGNNSVLALAVDSQQRILVGGTFTSFSSRTRSGLTRLNPDGTVDPTINFESGADGGFVDTLTVDANDEIDVGGGFTTFEGTSENNFVRLYGGANSGTGSIQFKVASYGVLQNGTNALVTLQRLGGEGTSNGPPVTVLFSTSPDANPPPGTQAAVAGVDYSNISTNVVFPYGETFVTVLVPLVNNSLAGSNKVVSLNLSSPTNTVVGSIATATLYITNVNTDVEFSAATYRDSANDPKGYATIPVLRLGNINTTVTVTVYTGINGSATPFTNYIPTSTNVTFFPGVTSNTFKVFLLNASNMFSDQTVDLEMSGPTNAIIGVPGSATLTIASVNTNAGVLAFSQTNYAVSEGAGQAVITVVRTNGNSGAVSVTLTTSNGTAIAGTNYLPVSTTLNFAAGATNQSTNITVIQQASAGPDTTVLLTLSNPQGGATIGGSAQEVLTIQNDIENFSFQQASESIPENSILTVPVIRGGALTNTVLVNYTTFSKTNPPGTNIYAVSNVDYVVTSGTLTFGSNVTQQSVSVDILQDNTFNGPLTFQIILSTNVSSSNVQLASPATNTVTINSDLTGFAFSSGAYSVAENGSNLVVTVYRINTNSQTASVQFTTSNGVNTNSAFNALSGIDYTTTNGTLTYAAGQATNSFTIPILNSNLVESNKTFTVSLSNPLIGGTPAYLVNPSNATVTITNNITTLSFGGTTETVSLCNVSQVSIPVNLTGATNKTVTVNYTTTNGTAHAGTNYFTSSGTLTFLPGQTSTNILVELINNHSGPNITFSVLMTNATNAQLINPVTNSVTIQECNGITGLTASAFASSAFITWSTPVPATYQVAYGTTTNYGKVTAVAGQNTNPVVLLTGLLRDTTYYYNVMSWENDSLYSSNSSFTTLDTLIVSTGSGQVSNTGTWTSSTAVSGFYGPYYEFAATTMTNATATASFLPVFSTPGFYNVSAWFPQNGNFTTNAQALVYGATNGFFTRFNETTNGGTWVPLATNLTYNTGTNGGVTVYNNTGETNKQVVANAVKWSYVTNQDYAIGTIPAWWSNWWSGYLGTNISAANYGDYVFGLPPNSLINATNFWATFNTNRTITAYFTPYQGGRVYQLQSATNLTGAQWVTLTNLPVVSTNSITNSYGVFSNGTGFGIITATFSNKPQTYFRLSAQPSTNY